MSNDADRLVKVDHYFAYSLLERYIKTRYTSLAAWNLSSYSPMFSDSERQVNCNYLKVLMGTTNMEDTIKFISLLLLVFPLFTEATHGGEYILYTVSSILFFQLLAS